MTPTELRVMMVRLECRSYGDLARLIGVDRSTIGTWIRGEVGVPRYIQMLLKIMVESSL